MLSADERPLSDAWLAWITESLLRNRSREEIAGVLAAEGLNSVRATHLVAEIAESSSLQAVEATIGPVRRASLLRRSVLRNSRRSLCRIPPDSDLYLEGFAAAQTPVVIEGITQPWLSLNLSWESLLERFGHEMVVALTGRSGAPDNPDIDWEKHRVELSFADLVTTVLDPETGNDTYATARCKLSAGPLRVLREELTFPSEFVAEAETGTAFIVGAAGAATRMHFDVSTTLLCQLLGRKRVWLIPPEEDVTSSELFWADPVDLDDPEMAIREVVMEPGDALSIPAGWWHQTFAEDPSFTVTLANLRQTNNRHDWFAER